MNSLRLTLFGLLLLVSACVLPAQEEPNWSDPNSAEPAFGTFGPEEREAFPQFIDMCLDDMLKAPEDRVVVCAMACYRAQYAGAPWCVRAD